MQQGSRFTILIILFLVISGGFFLSGIYLGYKNRPEALKILSLVNLEDTNSADVNAVDFSPFWETWNIIDEKFVGVGTTTEKQWRVWGAIEGLVASLEDPYSVFLSPRYSETFTENIDGNFGGVGVNIGINDNILTVVALLKDTPAEKAGVILGDKISLIDNISTTNMSINEAIHFIRGPVGTDVVLTVKRKGVEELFKVRLLRETISIPTIDTEARDDGIFIIKLYNFSGVSPQLFHESLKEFVGSGMDKLIIDVRGNPGGLVEAAVDIASWFLSPGKVVVTEDFGDNRENVVYRSKGYDIFNENLKTIILVNSRSASVTEIFASALSEYGVARLVGEKTFGKGSLQELIKITEDTSLKITIAHWLTPKGQSLSGNGIEPDFVVPLTEEDVLFGQDPQLEKAIQVLLN